MAKIKTPLEQAVAMYRTSISLHDQADNHDKRLSKFVLTLSLEDFNLYVTKTTTGVY